MQAAREHRADEAAEAAPAAAMARTQPAVLQLQRTIGNRATRRVLARSLDDDYQAAVRAPDWQRAAELLTASTSPTSCAGWPRAARTSSPRCIRARSTTRASGRTPTSRSSRRRC